MTVALYVTNEFDPAGLRGLEADYHFDGEVHHCRWWSLGWFTLAIWS